MCRHLFLVLITTSTLYGLLCGSFSEASAFVATSTLRNIKNLHQCSNQKRLAPKLFFSEILQAPEDAAASVYKRDPSTIDKEFDTIIVGSGVGGLATASLLAQCQQHKVLVLEQHYAVGGCLHTFEKKGYKFGIGIHYVGEMMKNTDEKDDDNDDTAMSNLMRVRDLLDAVSVEGDSVDWSAMPPHYDTIILGKNNERRYKMYAIDQAEKLKEQFPNDQEAIDQYYDLCQKAKKAFVRAVTFKMLPRRLVQMMRWTGLLRLFDKGYHKYSNKTLRQVVHSLTDNADLRAVLMYNWGDYGSLPNETPFCMHALLVDHYSKGGYYPTGGPDMIARKILPVITAHGGQVVTNAPVRRIVMQNEEDDNEANSKKKKKGAAVGVELMDGTIIRAKHAVVSDAGIVNTCRFLVPPSEQREAMLKRFMLDNTGTTTVSKNKTVQSGATALNLFVGLKGDHDFDLQLPRYHLFLFPSALIEEDLAKLPKTLEEGLEQVQPQDLAPLFVGSPSGKDKDWSKLHPGKSTLELLTLAPYTWFKKYAPEILEEADGAVDPGGRPGSHGSEYKQAKEKLAEIMYQRAREGLIDSGASTSLPETLANVDMYELGTPLSYAHYLRSNQGAFYGLNHDMNRFRPRIFFQELRPEVPEIPNLYLTGQDVASCGLKGALAGAYLCASKILGVHNPSYLLHEVENNRVVAKDSSPASRSMDQEDEDSCIEEDEVSIGLDL